MLGTVRKTKQNTVTNVERIEVTKAFEFEKRFVGERGSKKRTAGGKAYERCDRKSPWPFTIKHSVRIAAFYNCFLSKERTSCIGAALQQ